MATISQKSGEKYFKRFIVYSFVYVPILAFAHKKIPSQRERIRLVEWTGSGQGDRTAWPSGAPSTSSPLADLLDHLGDGRDRRIRLIELDIVTAIFRK